MANLAESSCRCLMFSFRYALVRCCSTVLTVMNNFPEISRFVYPWAANEVTLSSASDSNWTTSSGPRMIPGDSGFGILNGFGHERGAQSFGSTGLRHVPRLSNSQDLWMKIL
ncbi:MAG: hypothetical protein QG671_789 [Actinomycetota bacterium]|nr:hypothetical protein [Actinomycetota bacterium]